MTIRVWPSGWVCQAVRAPGSKVTCAPDTRAGAGASNSGSTRTAPVKYSAGPLPDGREPARLIRDVCASAGRRLRLDVPEGAAVSRDSDANVAANVSCLVLLVSGGRSCAWPRALVEIEAGSQQVTGPPACPPDFAHSRIGVVSTSRSDFTIFSVEVLYLTKCGDWMCAS